MKITVLGGDGDCGWACLTPAAPGEFRVFNQFTEQFSVLQRSDLVRTAGARPGYDVTIQHLPDPRVEREEHYYNAKHSTLLDGGLEAHFPDRVAARFADEHRGEVSGGTAGPLSREILTWPAVALATADR